MKNISTVEDVLGWKSRVESLQQKKWSREGVVKDLKKKLLEKYSVKSIEEGKELLKSLEEEAKELQKTLQEKIEKVRSKYGKHLDGDTE